MAHRGKRTQPSGAKGSENQELDPEAIIRDCERIFRTPDTDWDFLYLRLRHSKLGEDFPRNKFLRTPVKAIISALSYIDSEEQRQHNIAASTTAKLCLQVISIAHGMAGSKQLPKIDLKDFLPFPDWAPEGAPHDGPTAQTRSLLMRLLKQGRIPMPIFTQLLTSSAESR